MSPLNLLIVSLLVPLIPVYFIYRILGRYQTEASIKNKLIRVTGPGALYLILVWTCFEVLPKEPSPVVPQPPPMFRATIQLWPATTESLQFRQDFLNKRNARLYLTAAGSVVAFTEFTATQDYLEQTKEITLHLHDKPADPRIMPPERYRLQPGSRHLTKLLQFEVFSASRGPAAMDVRRMVGGREFRATTSIPVLTQVHTVEARLDPMQPIRNLSAGEVSLISLDGVNFSQKTALAIVDASGEPVGDAWIGNAMGSNNGKPIDVARDGTNLRSYAYVRRALANQYFLKVANPDGQTFSVPIDAVAQVPRPSTPGGVRPQM